jgi:ribosomal protein S18 acetylase RimI-like enzyme
MSMITLRPPTDADQDFMLELYSSTRADLAALSCDPAMRRQLIRMQSEAQQAHYRAHYPRAQVSLIVDADGNRIGRLYVDRGPHEIRLVDISLLPQHRRHGIGQQLVRALMAEGEQATLPVRLSVLSGNPALHLYQRLGFEADGMMGAHHAMQWRGDTALAEAGGDSISLL